MSKELLMIKKEYYRLDDLKHRFQMTEADVLYLLEQRHVRACFYVDNTKFIIGGWSNKGFVGYAHVQYRGLITIPESELQKLLRDRTVQPVNYLLPNCANISLLSTDYGFQLQTPNNYIHAWKSKPPTDISWAFIPAKLEPQVSDTFVHSIQKAVEVCLNQQNKTTETNLVEEKFRDLPKQKFAVELRKFLFSDICLSHIDLVACKAISAPTEAERLENCSTNLNNKTALHLNQLDKLILKIIIHDRTLTAKNVFKILAHESGMEEDSRHFDSENILLDNIDDLIIWKDSLSKTLEKKCSLVTLANKMTYIRKSLNTKE